METMRRFYRYVVDKVTGVHYEEESDIPKYTFYDTIEEFGYHFNEKGELLDADGGRFKFVVRENDRNYNQQHYDALGELITEYVYEKMETDLHLQKLFIPLDARKDEGQSFIFQSVDAGQCDTLMVVINGMGVVRAGQWSRKLIINEGLEVGSQLPYIRRARQLGFGVVVLNTNENQQTVNGKATDIRGSSSAEEHGLYVWEHIIKKTRAPNIVIVAHSYGGLVTCHMLEHFLEDFKQRVFCIVFTDSIHTVAARNQRHADVIDFLKERAVNFAAAYVPLDYMMLASPHSDCLSVSAGTEEHGRTSHACMESAFTLVSDTLASWTTDRSTAPRHFKPLPDDLSQFSCAARWQRQKERAAAQGHQHDGSSSVDAEDTTLSTPPVQSKNTPASHVLEEGRKEEAGKEEEEDRKEESVSKTGAGKIQEKKELLKDEFAASPAQHKEKTTGQVEVDSEPQKDAAVAEESTSKKQDCSDPVKAENDEHQKEEVAVSPARRQEESRGQVEGEDKALRKVGGGGGDTLSKNETKKEEEKCPKPSCEGETPIVTTPEKMVPGTYKEDEKEDSDVVAADTRESHPVTEDQELALSLQRGNEEENVEEGLGSQGEEKEKELEAGRKESEDAGSDREGGEVARTTADGGQQTA